MMMMAYPSGYATYHNFVILNLTMTKKEAISIANEFLKKKNLEISEPVKFRWILSIPKEFKTAWYFDYKYETIDPKENIQLGGAPGFKVNKNNQLIENVSWEDYSLKYRME